MRTRRPLLVEDEETKEIWPAFTDVMSTLALILFVLVLLSYVRSLVAKKRLDQLGSSIATSQIELRHVKDDLRRSRAELDAEKGVLQASTDRLHAQEETIASANQQLGAMRSQLESIAVLRLDVLNRLKAAIEAELGPAGDAGASLVTIGDNGNLLINESLVFESALGAFSAGTRDFSEFNAHLKDNVQRMSLSFGDLSDALKDQIVLLGRDDAGPDANGRRR